MQIYAINGSPRKTWNTATILQNVLDGFAESREDALTEMIDLYSLNYKGCVSCFECKRLGGPSYGRCAVRDGLGALLPRILQADALVIGSPIYFGDMSGMLRAFLERLLFPCLVYDKAHSSLAPRKIPTAFVYTMNLPRAAMEERGYPQRLAAMESYVGRLFGSAPRLLHVCDTLQFKDYSRYKMEIFSAEEKARQRELEFPVDCRRARELGAALAADAAGEA